MNQDELFPGSRLEKVLRVVNSSNDRHDRFIAAYLENGMNATAAAIAAGYTERSARNQGSRLLANDDIARKIAEKAEGMVRELDHSAARTLKEVARLAFVNAQDIFNPDGSVKKFSELDENTARAVSSVELGKDGTVKKLKFFDKGPAQDKLMRYHALYKDKLEVEGELTLVVDI